MTESELPVEEFARILEASRVRLWVYARRADRTRNELIDRAPRAAGRTATDLRHARRRWRSPHARFAARRSHGPRTLNNTVGLLRSLDVADYPGGVK
jgi:hypothetical protein